MGSGDGAGVEGQMVGIEETGSGGGGAVQTVLEEQDGVKAEASGAFTVKYDFPCLALHY